jgi:hypothetical protein
MQPFGIADLREMFGFVDAQVVYEDVSFRDFFDEFPHAFLGGNIGLDTSNHAGQ